MNRWHEYSLMEIQGFMETQRRNEQRMNDRPSNNNNSTTANRSTRRHSPYGNPGRFYGGGGRGFYGNRTFGQRMMHNGRFGSFHGRSYGARGFGQRNQGHYPYQQNFGNGRGRRNDLQAHQQNFGRGNGSRSDSTYARTGRNPAEAHHFDNIGPQSEDIKNDNYYYYGQLPADEETDTNGTAHRKDQEESAADHSGSPMDFANYSYPFPPHFYSPQPFEGYFFDYPWMPPPAYFAQPYDQGEFASSEEHTGEAPPDGHHADDSNGHY